MIALRFAWHSKDESPLSIVPVFLAISPLHTLLAIFVTLSKLFCHNLHIIEFIIFSFLIFYLLIAIVSDWHRMATYDPCTILDSRCKDLLLLC